MSTGLSAAGIGVGLLGALSPGSFAKIYGINADDREVNYLTVLFSTRNTALSTMALMTSDPGTRKKYAAINAAMQFTDVFMGLKARRSGLDGRSTIAGPVTSAAFGAVAAYVALTS